MGDPVRALLTIICCTCDEEAKHEHVKAIHKNTAYEMTQWTTLCFRADPHLSSCKFERLRMCHCITNWTYDGWTSRLAAWGIAGGSDQVSRHVIDTLLFLYWPRNLGVHPHPNRWLRHSVLAK